MLILSEEGGRGIIIACAVDPLPAWSLYTRSASFDLIVSRRWGSFSPFYRCYNPGYTHENHRASNADPGLEPLPRDSICDELEIQSALRVSL